MSARIFRRLAVLLVAVLVAGMLAAVPSAGYTTKAVTRILAAKTLVVNNDVPEVDPWPKSLTVHLQKRITSTHYHALFGTVNLYVQEPGGPGYHWIATKRGSTVTFSLPRRGKYKIYYSGTSTTRPATAYTEVYETVGFEITTPSVSVTAVPGTDSPVLRVVCRVWWNESAVPRLWLKQQTDLYADDTYDDPAARLRFEHECVSPGVVEFLHPIEGWERYPGVKIACRLRGYVDTVEEPFYGLNGRYVKMPAPSYCSTRVP